MEGSDHKINTEDPENNNPQCTDPIIPSSLQNTSDLASINSDPFIPSPGSEEFISTVASQSESETVLKPIQFNEAKGEDVSHPSEVEPEVEAQLSIKDEIQEAFVNLNKLMHAEKSKVQLQSKDFEDPGISDERKVELLTKLSKLRFLEMSTLERPAKVESNIGHLPGKLETFSDEDFQFDLEDDDDEEVENLNEADLEIFELIDPQKEYTKEINKICKRISREMSKITTGLVENPTPEKMTSSVSNLGQETPPEVKSSRNLAKNSSSKALQEKSPSASWDPWANVFGQVRKSVEARSQYKRRVLPKPKNPQAKPQNFLQLNKILKRPTEKQIPTKKLNSQVKILQEEAQKLRERARFGGIADRVESSSTSKTDVKSSEKLKVLESPSLPMLKMSSRSLVAKGQKIPVLGKPGPFPIRAKSTFSGNGNTVFFNKSNSKIKGANENSLRILQSPLNLKPKVDPELHSVQTAFQASVKTKRPSYQTQSELRRLRDKFDMYRVRNLQTEMEKLRKLQEFQTKNQKLIRVLEYPWKSSIHEVRSSSSKGEIKESDGNSNPIRAKDVKSRPIFDGSIPFARSKGKSKGLGIQFDLKSHEEGQATISRRIGMTKSTALRINRHLSSAERLSSESKSGKVKNYIERIYGKENVTLSKNPELKGNVSSKSGRSKD